MSRVFKSSCVNLGDPLKVKLREQDFIIKEYNTQGSSVEDNSPANTASNIIARANFEANQIMETVNNQIREMYEHAKSEAEIIKRNIVDEAYNKGFQQGLMDGKMETEELANQALSIKEELEHERENLLSQLETQIPELIIEGVKKIIGQELSTNKNVIISLVSNALRKTTASAVAVKVSEFDFETVHQAKGEIMSQNKHISEVEVIKDMSLECGDCVVETNCGEVDSSINTQVNNFEKIIMDISGDKNE